MVYKDVEDRRNYDKHWRKTTKGRRYVKRQRKRWLATKGSQKVLARAYHKYTTSEKGRESRKRWRIRVKAECIKAYGGKCKCCGENNPLFLTMDHINGGGVKHRRELKGVNFWYWLRKQRFPKKHYQLLCMQCNFGMRINGGICPHKERRGPRA